MSTPPRHIYFDHNATTAVAPQAIAAMVHCLQQGALNPSSKHSRGELAKSLLQLARAKVCRLLSCTPAELVFTASGTEANNLAIRGALALRPERRHIISSEVEHPATLMLLHELEAQGYRLTLLPVGGDGQLNLDALRDTLLPETALVSLMWANNETGVIFDVQGAARITHEQGALFHTDAVQAVGKLAINLGEAGSADIDLLSFSGHKLHAPAGTGGLFVRKGVKIPALLPGHQERGRRGGTENMSGLVALGAACEMLSASLAAEQSRLATLRDVLEQGVLSRVPTAIAHGATAPRLANTSNIGFGEIDSELLLTRLDRLGIQASAGAACSSAGTKPSHVLTAMGCSAAQALGSIRFSLGSDNTAEQVEYLLDVLPALIDELQRMPMAEQRRA